MLLAVTLRTDKAHAYTHIVNDQQRRALCGIGVPEWLTYEDQTRNPYIGKNPISCGECATLYEAGARAFIDHVVVTTDDEAAE